MKVLHIWRMPRGLTLRIAKTSLLELVLNISPFGTSEGFETDSSPPFERFFQFCKVSSQENNTPFAPNSWRNRKICGNPAETSTVEKKQKGNKKMQLLLYNYVTTLPKTPGWVPGGITSKRNIGIQFLKYAHPDFQPNANKMKRTVAFFLLAPNSGPNMSWQIPFLCHVPMRLLPSPPSS